MMPDRTTRIWAHGRENGTGYWILQWTAYLLPQCLLLHEGHQSYKPAQLEAVMRCWYASSRGRLRIGRSRIPIAIDQKDQATVAAYGVTSFPTTVLIGRDGTFRGYVGRYQLLLELMQELKKQPAE